PRWLGGRWGFVGRASPGGGAGGQARPGPPRIGEGPGGPAADRGTDPPFGPPPGPAVLVGGAGFQRQPDRQHRPDVRQPGGSGLGRGVGVASYGQAGSGPAAPRAPPPPGAGRGVTGRARAGDGAGPPARAGRPAGAGGEGGGEVEAGPRRGPPEGPARPPPGRRAAPPRQRRPGPAPRPGPQGRSPPPRHDGSPFRPGWAGVPAAPASAAGTHGTSVPECIALALTPALHPRSSRRANGDARLTPSLRPAWPGPLGPLSRRWRRLAPALYRPGGSGAGGGDGGAPARDAEDQPFFAQQPQGPLDRGRGQARFAGQFHDRGHSGTEVPSGDPLPEQAR